MKQYLLGALFLTLASSIWGSMYVVSKYVLDYIPPLTLVWLRYLVAFIFLYMILKLRQSHGQQRRMFTKKDWFLLGWIGFIGYFVSISFQFIGTHLSNAHTGALITSTTPAFMVIFAWLILKEKLTVAKLVSVMIATLGVIIVIGWDVGVGSFFKGSLFLMGAAMTWSLMSVYVKVASERFSALEITTYAMLFALIFTTPMMFWELLTYSIVLNGFIMLGVLYLGTVSTAGAFFLWNKGLELIEASIGSLFFFFQPLVGAWLGWLLLDETLELSFYMGALCIFVSMIFVTFHSKQFTHS